MGFVEVSCPTCGHTSSVDESELRAHDAGITELWCAGCDDVF